jgi:SpoVK/Ycf46/Vps4 family AAA+-type ATPase
MLTQMESFSGVFVASTNLMEGLDHATLRRFDLKVRFDYLRCEQAHALFLRHCAGLGLPEPTSQQLTRLAGLKKLTPGDFATVARQNRFHPIRSSGDLLNALEAECAAKNGARAIGFVL